MSIVAKATVASLAVSLALPSAALASAGPLTSTRPLSSTSLPTAIARVRAQWHEMHELAKKMFSEGKYESAAVMWKEALAQVAPTPETQAVRDMLIINVATAYERAAPSSSDPDRTISLGVVALREYIDRHSHLPIDRGVHEKLSQMQRSVDQSANDNPYGNESGSPYSQSDSDASLWDQTSEPAPAPSNAAPQPAPQSTAQPVPVADEPQLRRVKTMQTALGKTGIALMAVGVAAGAYMGAEFIIGHRLNTSIADTMGSDRLSAINRGRISNTMVIVGGVTSGVMLMAGTALLIAGSSRAKRLNRRNAGLGLRPSLLLTPNFAGTQLSGSF